MKLILRLLLLLLVFPSSEAFTKKKKVLPKMNIVNVQVPPLIKQVQPLMKLDPAPPADPVRYTPPVYFEKVIIWGHKLHSHTHSYIHERFYRAFQHLGYATYWFDDADNVSDFDFSNSLFLTEGQVDKNIPVRNDCYYLLHHCKMEKYKPLYAAGRCASFRFFSDQVMSLPSVTKVDTCIYYDIPDRCIYIPWAADLLPHEIEQMKKKLPLPRGQYVYWLGTIGTGGCGKNSEQLAPFIRACRENGISFIHNDPWAHGLDSEAFRTRTATSYLAPAIVNAWQERNGYIPCRIFIAIVNGHMGVTNSKRVFEFFDKKIVYNPDTYQLFYDAQERLKTWTLEDQHELMDIVKTKHTYLNRIQVLLEFFSLISPSESISGTP